MSSDNVSPVSAPVVATVSPVAATPVNSVVPSAPVVPVAGTGIATPASEVGTAVTAPAMTVAPGSAEPEAKPKRVPFPKLVEAGGKFFSYDRANPEKGGHFDVTLMPELPPWPELKDVEGNVIPLPWLGHSRLNHLALTSDCFNTEAEYKYFLCWERYEKSRAARAEYMEALTGASADASKALKKTERVEKELAAMAGLLAGKGIDINAVLAALGQIKSEATAQILGETA